MCAHPAAVHGLEKEVAAVLWGTGIRNVSPWKMDCLVILSLLIARVLECKDTFAINRKEKDIERKCGCLEISWGASVFPPGAVREREWSADG